MHFFIPSREIVVPGKVPLARHGLEVVPIYVREDCVETESLGFLEPVCPICPRDTLRIDLSAKDLEAFAIEIERMAVVGECSIGGVCYYGR